MSRGSLPFGALSRRRRDVRMGRTSIVALAVVAGLACQDPERATRPADSTASLAKGPLNPAALAQGQSIFRFDTFGDETFWTDTLRMHEVIRTALTPLMALGLGLKVDVDALPAAVVDGIKAGTIPLDDPATTVTLLKLGAVVGVIGQVDASNLLTRVGVTCALCHSTVDDSFSPGIGHRLDGWPNRDLDVGEIVSFSPAPSPAQKAVFLSWGPGMYDPRFNIDGENTPLVLPPAFGLRHVALETYTGDGVVSYWNAYVAITQMHGHGHFVDSRIGVDINNPVDQVSSKLDALRAYQFSLETPAAVAGDFDTAAARRGKQVFQAEAGCARCHLGSTYTDVNTGKLHSPVAVGQDPAYALRTATKLYRTTPLRGLWNPPQLKGPYFHDGSAPSLAAVVDHYVTTFGLTLTAQQKSDLVEYLKTL